MMKKFFYFFVFAILSNSCVNAQVKRISETKKEVVTDHLTWAEPLFKDLKDSTMVNYLVDSILNCSSWQKAEGTYYYPMRMKNNSNGKGTSGNKIKSGSVALGSVFFKKMVQKGIIVFIEIKDCNIVTPYGKGIFRIDDTMGARYNNPNKTNKFFIDFFHKDVTKKQKSLGRFNVLFRVVKILTIPVSREPLAGIFLFIYILFLYEFY